MAEKQVSALYFSGASETEFMDELRVNLRRGCKLVVGIFTSRECLLAGPVLKEFGAYALSPTCGHNRIAEFHPHIKTAVPSIDTYSKTIADHVNLKRGQKVLLFFQPTDAFSKNSAESLRRYLTGPIEVIEVDREGQVSEKFTASVSHRETTIVFTTYPIVSVAVIDQLAGKGWLNRNVEVIASTSWAFDLSAVMRQSRVALRRAKFVLVPTVFGSEAVKKSRFYRRFKKKYGEDPGGLFYMSYDTTRVAIDCALRGTSSERILRCLEGEHAGITGRLRFDKASPFADRPIILERLALGAD